MHYDDEIYSNSSLTEKYTVFTRSSLISMINAKYNDNALARSIYAITTIDKLQIKNYILTST